MGRSAGDLGTSFRVRVLERRSWERRKRETGGERRFLRARAGWGCFFFFFGAQRCAVFVFYVLFFGSDSPTHRASAANPHILGRDLAALCVRSCEKQRGGVRRWSRDQEAHGLLPPPRPKKKLAAAPPATLFCFGPQSGSPNKGTPARGVGRAWTPFQPHQPLQC